MQGFDLDGVIDTGRYHPSYDDVIITGNMPSNFAHVMKVMKDNNVACAVYFNPYETKENDIIVAGWKAEIINKLGCTDFYEDNPQQVKILKDLCPKTNIEQV